MEVKIEKEIKVLSENEKSKWVKLLALVSWNGREPSLEIRNWSPDRSKMSKGIALTKEELEILKTV